MSGWDPCYYIWSNLSNAHHHDFTIHHTHHPPISPPLPPLPHIRNRYRWVPLLPELKEMTDWVFTDSSLSLTQWLTVEEIWSSLYPVRLVQNQVTSQFHKFAAFFHHLFPSDFRMNLNLGKDLWIYIHGERRDCMVVAWSSCSSCSYGDLCFSSAWHQRRVTSTLPMVWLWLCPLLDFL